MNIVNVEPLIHGELLATKISFKFQDKDGNYDKDNFLNVLLNCGWSLDFSEEKLNLYKKYAQNVDVILITDGDFLHSGALLWLTSRFLTELKGKSIPKILCTEGTYKFMRASLIDVLENVTFSTDFGYYSMDDLELLDSNCVKLRYSETYCHMKKLQNLDVKSSFCALNNGYSVGGAIWKISVGYNTVICGDKIRIYTGTLLNGANINDILNPDLLVLSHEDVETPKHVTDPKGVKVCEDLNSLTDKLFTTLTKGGNILFPMDVDYTLLNLLIHLNMIWSTSQLSQFKIVLASPIADKLMLFIGTCLEYMKTSIFHNFIKTLWNPFMDLNHIEIITSLGQLSRYRFRPTVFISTTSNMDFGFSNFLFLAISSYYKNLVVLTKPNQSVTKYVYNRNNSGVQAPQYKETRLINVLDDEPEEQENEKIGNDTYLQNYTNLAGQSQFHMNNLQNTELDSKNIQDYGLPFNDLLADPANPYGYTELPAYEGEFESEVYNAQEQNENSELDDYYRKYLDDPKNKLFDMDSTDEAYQKSDFMTKKFPFCVKSDICIVNSLCNILKETQMPSLLYRIQPRNAVLIPTSESSLVSEKYLSKLLRCKLHSFYENKRVKNEPENKNPESNERIKSLVSVDLNFNNFPVMLNLNLLTAVKNFFNKPPPTELVKRTAGNYQTINTVLNSLEQWKYKNNRVKSCQILGKLTCAEESQQDPPKTNLVSCHTFWSDECNKKSKLEFVIEDKENNDPETENYQVKNSIKSTLLIGNVSMANYTKFLDDCIPNAISMISGSAVINDKVIVSKHSNTYSNQWVIEGTLDPSYYLARKLLRKLHNRIEPIY
ncbi:uncharacterized protein TA11620 [Theileria annulata]|uniref:Cleavage and polyadenylation specificity factor subunit 2 n=1 Tax=Theileria annulata TaxID=5874 RepID=Q4UDL0_THEAN|nr:uncharacterized protein TA11620 [Theileria annulata]CAI74829.1 hypothetical protein TA11620 [Theileria annulata]|eukprot:XP_952561.1 hypothetical protein TA11620 [Theileria annulata]